MSAGPFTIANYEADSGEIHLLKQQPESAVFSINGSPNTLPAGPATSPFWAKASRGAREYGLRPRKLRFKFTAGSEPTGYADCGVLEVVVYSLSVYNNAVVGGAATYLGAPGRIVGRVPEDIYPVV